jgi:hypothetical protein
MTATPIDFLLASDSAHRQIGRASVVGVFQDGSVAVAGVGFDDLRCDVLLTGAGAAPALVPGQAVLVWHPGHAAQRGVVLGRIGAARAGEPAPEPGAVAHPPLASSLPPGGAEPGDEVPDRIVLEARHSLTLRVGDGSITLRADGRVLIEGRDLVSSARRLNRIKGGAVSIN